MGTNARMGTNAAAEGARTGDEGVLCDMTGVAWATRAHRVTGRPAAGQDSGDGTVRSRDYNKNDSHYDNQRRPLSGGSPVRRPAGMAAVAGEGAVPAAVAGASAPVSRSATRWRRSSGSGWPARYS